MEHTLQCECGKEKVVNEGSAGATLRCECGASLHVPSLSEMRALAGESPYPITPDLVLEERLKAGNLPAEGDCPICNEWTQKTVNVLIECERPQRQTPSRLEMFFAAVGGWFTMLLHTLANRDDIVHGKEKIYTVPLVICDNCAPQLRSKAILVSCLRARRVYRDLLESYPDAVIELCNHDS